VRRERAAIDVVDRACGIDVNVSNITVASHDDGSAFRITRIERDATQKARERKQTRRDRQRKRALDRSRRAMNRDQYRLSKRQQKRARRREQAGLRAVQVVPRGPRIASSANQPLRSYRRDTLSTSYRRMRAAQAADAAATTQARAARARQTAAELVATHGYRPIVEAISIAAWSRSWGRAVAAFSPGALIAAIDREAKAVAGCAGGTGGVERASTRTTALSQHCPCGVRVPKSLDDRVHRCPACSLVGDRDAVSAVLASFVGFGTRGDPASAEVDYTAAIAALPAIRRALRPSYSGWQDTLSESTDLSAREGLFLAWPTSTPDSVVVARRTVGMAPYPILDEPGTRQTTSARAWMRTTTFRTRSPCWPYLRDVS
jgi:hypothetical protein